MVPAEMTAARRRAAKKPTLGIDLGGTKILGGLVSPQGEILASSKKKTRAEKGPDQILERLVNVAIDTARKAGLEIADVAGLGIGAPGQIDHGTGSIVYAPNLGWRDIPLVEHLSEALGIPVALDNDVNVVAVAEHLWGRGQEVDDLVAISVGTGIGAGIILGGELWHGFNGTAGEIGHTVIDQDGPKWKASNRGCLESMASRMAIALRLEKAMKNGQETSIFEETGGKASEIRSKVLKRAVAGGDPLVIAELEESARLIGIAVGNVINFLNPEMIVMGGGMIESLADVMMPIIEKTARRCAIANAAQDVQIVASELGDSAGLLGAAALVR